MDREILDLLDDEQSNEPCSKPLSIPVQESFKTRWTRVGEITKQAYGKNKLPRLGRRALMDLVDLVEAAALKRIEEKARNSA